MRIIFKFSYILIAVFAFLLTTGSQIPQNKDDILVNIALEIFPRLVAVDLDVSEKLSHEGKIQLLVFYYSQKDRATNTRNALAEKFDQIAGFPVEIVAADELPETPPTAILIVERLKENQIATLTDYAVTNNILLFSPFEEDVKKGITAGISILARVVPSFNRDTLTRSGIRIHDIVLRSAVIYD